MQSKSSKNASQAALAATEEALYEQAIDQFEETSISNKSLVSCLALHMIVAVSN